MLGCKLICPYPVYFLASLFGVSCEKGADAGMVRLDMNLTPAVLCGGSQRTDDDDDDAQALYKMGEGCSFVWGLVRKDNLDHG